MEFFRKENEEPTPKFVRRKDDITGDDDDVMRVEMSCGHAADPGSLTGWCRSLLDQGHLRFHCPADVNGEKCGKEWSYPEVRRNASLTETEQQNFEEKLAKFAAKYYYDFKECPNCKSFVERRDLKNLRVVCILCHSLKGEVFEFCWQCLKPWKGAGAPSERCENEGCKNQSLEVLANCKLKDLPGSEIKNCPSIRACPTCGRLIEHMEKCKYIVCPQCQVEFCFACLEIARNCQASKGGAYFKYCAKPLAPKQTQIPVWAQK
ncbi:E3 ubiquitin-protein ligase DDB_G0292642-like isoform X1 [Lepidochelys kempii]|uniref:E3 ubiquitin-protein ligase DDB_G0292642-like isoform X1 n=1 Tax=Lepidochelys kempii TaxID=8472 RepID=UPI003C6ECA89